MADRLLLPPQILGADGRPVSGAKLNTYVTGTSTRKQVFTDAALTIAHANPTIADSAGRFPAMFLAGGDYRVVLTDSADAVIATYDPVAGAETDTSGSTGSPFRNRLINPGMQISQENGTTVVALTDGAAYVLDGWVGALSSTPGGTLWLNQAASATPGGSPFRLRATANVADATISAGDFYRIEQRIEGAAFADARFGTASARQILVRLGVLSSLAGTFGVSLTNSAGNRSWVGTFSIAAGEINTAVERTIAIPGDTAGTWLTGPNEIGAVLRICLTAGSTFHGAAGWQAGNYLTTSSQTQWMSTGSASFEVFDAGVYVDALAAGEFPTWELPDYAAELQRAQRYWQAHGRGLGGTTVSTTAVELDVLFPVEMMKTPTIAQIGSDAAIRTAGATGTVAGTVATVAANTRGATVTYTRGAGSWTANVGASIVDADNILSFDARL